MIEPKSHEYFMKKALDLAKQAFEENEIPIGAIIVSNERIIGKGYNQVEKLGDATAHAEMIAITSAADFLNSKYLKNCTMYVTIEPCVMCGGALKWSQIDKIVYGASEDKFGFFSEEIKGLPKKVEVVSGVMEDECSELLLEFFRLKRE
ncbi:MAG: tRNA(adenine34) deaminase [Planctomycetota bacterium]|jgi:tRNA(adenine34) deaminase